LFKQKATFANHFILNIPTCFGKASRAKDPQLSRALATCPEKKPVAAMRRPLVCGGRYSIVLLTGVSGPAAHPVQLAGGIFEYLIEALAESRDSLDGFTGAKK
jgi:hypothetical protein